jgi:glycosyltransferase involved in cell wall biosynthesis
MKIKMIILKLGIINSSKRADQIIALSMKCKILLQACGVDEKKIIVINNGVEELTEISMPFSSDVIEKFGINSKYFLYVSSFFPYKRFDTVIKSYNLLPAEVKKEFKLVLVGTVQNKKYFNELVELSRSLGIEENVVFVPELSKNYLYRFYSDSEIFIFASSIENCPNILLEAMSSGCSILCSSDDPMPEFGSDSVEYFNSSDANELSSKILKLVNDPHFRLHLSKLSKLRAKNFSWELFTSRVVRIYNP